MTATPAVRVPRVVVATDSFKGSLTSLDAGNAIRDGVLHAAPHADVQVVAIADGGEGTIEALRAAGPLDEITVSGVDALGRPLVSSYGRRGGASGGTAVIEAARSIGLAQVGEIGEWLPPVATSYGLGLHLRDALERRPPDHVLVGLGGTASTDGGVGVLLALGAGIVAAEGEAVAASGNALLNHRALVVSELPDLSGVEVLTDVSSPLLGPEGASRMFGPQKGATPRQVAALETSMTRWADALEVASGRAVRDVPGSGAAGGIGAALVACGARLTPGFQRIADEVGLRPLLATAEVVFTGEGRVDAQTALGKGPAQVAAMARTAGSAVVVGLGGDVSGADLGDAGPAFDAIFPVHRAPIALTAAMDPEVTRHALRTTSSEVIRLVLAVRRRGADGRTS